MEKEWRKERFYILWERLKREETVSLFNKMFEIAEKERDRKMSYNKRTIRARCICLRVKLCEFLEKEELLDAKEESL